MTFSKKVPLHQVLLIVSTWLRGVLMSIRTFQSTSRRLPAAESTAMPLAAPEVLQWQAESSAKAAAFLILPPLF